MSSAGPPSPRTAGFAVVAMIRPDLDSDDYRGHLWIVPTDASVPPRPFTSSWRDTAPAWSPDGAWLAFLRVTGKEGAGARPAIYVMPTDGGEPRRVTDQPLGAGAPVWSPDSRRIAYVARVPEPGRYLPAGLSRRRRRAAQADQDPAVPRGQPRLLHRPASARIRRGPVPRRRPRPRPRRHVRPGHQRRLRSLRRRLEPGRPAPGLRLRPARHARHRPRQGRLAVRP